MKRSNDLLKMVLFALFVAFICLLAAMSGNAYGKSQAIEAQRIQDMGDTDPVLPPPDVMTRQELIDYVIFLQENNTRLQDALNVCGSYYLPSIMDNVGANFAVFFRLQDIEAVVDFLDSSGVPAFIVWDKLVDMRLEEGDISFGQEEPEGE